MTRFISHITFRQLLPPVLMVGLFAVVTAAFGRDTGRVADFGSALELRTASDKIVGDEVAVLTDAPYVPPPIKRTQKAMRLADGVEYMMWTFGGYREPVTRGGYSAFMKSGAATGHSLDSPMTGVSWFAATAYCEAQGKRLPTSDEWEYAAGASETKADATRDHRFRERLLGMYAARATGAAIGVADPSNYPAFVRYAVRAGLSRRSTMSTLGFRCAAHIT